MNYWNIRNYNSRLMILGGQFYKVSFVCMKLSMGFKLLVSGSDKNWLLIGLVCVCVFVYYQLIRLHFRSKVQPTTIVIAKKKSQIVCNSTL